MNRNYKYGLREPESNAEIVAEQMFLAHRYRNALVEVELTRRADTESVMLELCPDLVSVEETISQIDQEIESKLAAAKQDAQRDRTRPRRDPEVAQLRKRLKAARAERKRLRAEQFMSEQVQESLRAVNDTAAAAVRAARGNCGVYWGTYLLVEQSADSFRKGAPPRFARWRGDGRIGVQLQGGAAWEDIIAGVDTRLRIIPTPQTKPRITKSGKQLPMPSEKRLSQQYTVWIRVGSNGRDPIWATFPCILHRHPPNGTRVKWATVHRRRVAGNDRWSLTLSLEAVAHAFQQPVASGGILAVDLGYRLRASGRLRVAYTHDDRGAGEEIAIPAGKVCEWRKVEELQSIRDQRFNDVKSELREWMRVNVAPEWLMEATEHMYAWKNTGRMDRLVRQWTRFDGDESIYGIMTDWRQRERHLWEYQENLRDQLLAWRKNFYRNLVADWRKRYAVVILEKMDLRDLHDVLRPKDMQEVESNVRWAARTAGLSILRQCITEGGFRVLYIDPKNTTRECHVCHGICEWDQATQLRHTCDHCTAEWDQDDNAARNLLASGQAMLDSQESLAGVATQGVKLGSSNTKKLSRSERLQAARKGRRKSKSGK